MAKKHLIFVDLLNILSCFAVVALHTSLNVFTVSRSTSWLESLLLQALFIFAVPIFFMISGMNLIGYRDRYSTPVFFRRRLLRVGRALLLASILCYALFALFPHSFYGAESFAHGAGIVDFVRRFLTNNIVDIYWFLYAIIYLYMLTPLLSLAKDNKRVVEYVLIVTACISIGIPLLERCGIDAKYFGQLFNWPLFSSVSLFYFMLGYYLSHFVRRRIPSWILISGALLSVIASFASALWINGWFGSNMNGAYHNYPISTESPFTAVLSACLFILFMQSERLFTKIPARWTSFIRRVSGASLGVYLFHILIINWAGVNLTGSVAVFWQRLPFIRAVITYLITAFIVIVAKELIRQCKRLPAHLSSSRHSTENTTSAPQTE